MPHIDSGADARSRRRVQTRLGCLSALLPVFLFAHVVISIYGFDREGGRLFLVGGFGLWLLVGIVVLVRANRNWRCPACNVALPTTMFLQPAPIRICESCGARLVVDWDEVGPSMPGEWGY